MRAIVAVLAVLVAVSAAVSSLATGGVPREPTQEDSGSESEPSAVPAVRAGAAPERPRDAPRRRPRERAASPAPEPDAALTFDEALRERGIVRGVVRFPDGRPAADAFVALGDLDCATETTLADAEGRFGFDDWVSHGSVEAVLRAGGADWRGRVGADGCCRGLEVTLAPAEEDRLVFVHVRDPEGGDVPRALVECVSLPLQYPDRLRRSRVARGACAVPTWFPRAEEGREPEPYVFLVSQAEDAEGRALPWGPAMVAIRRDGPRSVEVRLPRGVALAGRIEDPDGRPVAGAVLLLRPSPPAGFESVHLPGRIAETDEAGRFRIDGLAPGDVTFSVHTRTQHVAVVRRDVPAGTEEIVVRLPRLVPVAFHLTDGAGAPVVDALVGLCGSGAAWSSTGAEGTCEVPDVPEGGVFDAIVEPGAGLASFPVRFVAGKEPVRLVAAPEVPLRGRVLGPDGAPLPDVLVRVDRADGVPAEKVRGDPFVLRRLPAGALVTLSVADSTGRRVASAEAIAGADGTDDEDRSVVLRLPTE